MNVGLTIIRAFFINLLLRKKDPNGDKKKISEEEQHDSKE